MTQDTVKIFNINFFPKLVTIRFTMKVFKNNLPLLMMIGSSNINLDKF